MLVNIWSRTLRSLSVLVATLGCPLWAAMQDDTVRLSAHLKTLRGLKAMPAAQFDKIQAEYMDWIDRRMTAGIDLEKINRELASARLIPQPIIETTDFARSDSGYLGRVVERGIRGADDLIVIEAAITTGVYCSEDVTAIIYRRNPVKRAGWINGQRLDGHGFYLTGIAAGEELDGSRIIATGWNLTN